MKNYFLGLVLIAISNYTLAFEYTVEITEREIQDKVSASQPLKQQRLGTTFIFDSIKIDLVEKADKIAIKSDVEAQTPTDLKILGNVALQGNLRYHRETGEFFIDNPQITDINLKGISDSTRAALTKSTQLVMQVIFNRVAIYKLNDSATQRLAKALIKSVEIRNEKLYVKLGI